MGLTVDISRPDQSGRVRFSHCEADKFLYIFENVSTVTLL